MDELWHPDSYFTVLHTYGVAAGNHINLGYDYTKIQCRYHSFIYQESTSIDKPVEEGSNNRCKRK